MQNLLELFNYYNIYFNFFSFGTLLVTVFMMFLTFFFFSIKNKSKPTFEFAMMCMWFSLFFLGYFIAAALYSPVAVYHRFLTVGFIFPGLLHLVQWIFRYPTDSHPKTRRGFLYAQYGLAIITLAIFIWRTSSVGVKFHANGHYWDFDAEAISKYVAYLIMAYVFLVPGVGTWKVIITKKRTDRLAITGVVFCIIFGAVVPSILNTLSRDGVVGRGLFLNALVLMTIVAFFAIIIIFLNTTTDKTTFMAKIVGISIVTFLLMLQGMAVISMEDREKEYDQLHLQHLVRATEGGSIDSEMTYLYSFNLKDRDGRLEYTNNAYFDLPSERRIDFFYTAIEHENTALYEEIANLDPQNVDQGLRNLIAKTSPEFAGYKKALELFLESNKFHSNPSIESVYAEVNELNNLTFVNGNRISYISDEEFRPGVIAYLNKNKGAEFAPFKEVLLNELNAKPDLQGHELKLYLHDYLAPFTPQHSRHYRLSRDGVNHFIAYTVYKPERNMVYEAGFFYRDYRAFIHQTAFKQVTILAVVLIVVLVIFPLFFKISLVNPLNELLDGVEQVNKGSLQVEVPVHVQDEIGFLAGSFNKMVTSIRDARDQLQDYANNLEDMVKARTAELNESLEEVKKLKIQQDGDYYLTSLLMRPLNFNANKSTRVKSNFVLQQKKQFDFRDRHADLGGDVCVTGNLRLGTKDNYKRYIVAMNGDAMGKSMQGAGGALVMGVVMNSIMARSASQNRVLNVTPEQWLTDVYEEIHGVFKAFNGSMVISCTLDVIDEETGEMFYFNAEHPFQILYRNGKASFIEEDLQLRKLGLESEIPFEVKRFQLEPGDVIIGGSDGRDDIDLTPGDAVRTINEDEYLILGIVEQAKADLNEISRLLKTKGDITDDLSILKIEYIPQRRASDTHETHEASHKIDKPIVLIDDHDEVVLSATVEDAHTSLNSPEYQELIIEGRKLIRAGRSAEALTKLEKAYDMRQDDPSLNKILAVLTFREKEYEKAVEILENYLQEDPNLEDFWLYLSIAHKRMGNLERALESAEKVFEINHRRVPNLLQLSDLHLRMGHTGRAHIYVEQVFQIDPQNSQAKILEEKIARANADSTKSG